MATQPTQGPQLGQGTLSKFGVPLPTSSNGGILMPKLKYRFSVIATNFGDAASGDQLALTQQTISCGRPNLQFNRNELHSYNNVMYIPQKPQWQTIELVVRDDITGIINAAVSDQLQKQQNFYTMSSGMAGINFKFQLYICTLDGSNPGNSSEDSAAASSALEAWYLEGCFIEVANYDSFDYSSSDPVTISLTISFDNATQNVNPATNAEGQDTALTGVGQMAGTRAG